MQPSNRKKNNGNRSMRIMQFSGKFARAICTLSPIFLPSDRVFLIATRKALWYSSSGDLWQRDQTGLNELCRQTKKSIGLESHLLVQIAVLFKCSAFSSTILQSSNWEKRITTVEKILDFFILIVKFSFYVI